MESDSPWMKLSHTFFGSLTYKKLNINGSRGMIHLGGLVPVLRQWFHLIALGVTKE